jgi:arylsulfatase
MGAVYRARDASQAFVATHFKSLQEFPPRQAANPLSLHKALEAVMAKMERAKTTNN